MQEFIQHFSTKRLHTLAAILAFVVLFHSNTAGACQELPSEPPSIYDNDIVLLGKVKEVNSEWKVPDKPDFFNPGILVTYEILRHYHGVDASQRQITVIASASQTTQLFTEGEIGLVVANYSEEYGHFYMGIAHIFDSACSQGYYQNEKAMQEVEHQFKEQHKPWIAKLADRPFLLLFVVIWLIAFLDWLIRRRKQGRPSFSKTTPD